MRAQGPSPSFCLSSQKDCGAITEKERMGGGSQPLGGQQLGALQNVEFGCL